MKASETGQMPLWFPLWVSFCILVFLCAVMWRAGQQTREWVDTTEQLTPCIEAKPSAMSFDRARWECFQEMMTDS